MICNTNLTSPVIPRQIVGCQFISQFLFLFLFFFLICTSKTDIYLNKNAHEDPFGHPLCDWIRNLNYKKMNFYPCVINSAEIPYADHVCFIEKGEKIIDWELEKYLKHQLFHFTCYSYHQRPDTIIANLDNYMVYSYLERNITRHKRLIPLLKQLIKKKYSFFNYVHPKLVKLLKIKQPNSKFCKQYSIKQNYAGLIYNSKMQNSGTLLRSDEGGYVFTRYKGTKAISWIMKYLNIPVYRNAAVLALGRLGNNASHLLPLLKSMLKQDLNIYTKLYILWAISEIEHNNKEVYAGLNKNELAKLLPNLYIRKNCWKKLENLFLSYPTADKFKLLVRIISQSDYKLPYNKKIMETYLNVLKPEQVINTIWQPLITTNNSYFQVWGLSFIFKHHRKDLYYVKKLLEIKSKDKSKNTLNFSVVRYACETLTSGEIKIILPQLYSLLTKKMPSQIKYYLIDMITKVHPPEKLADYILNKRLINKENRGDSLLFLYLAKKCRHLSTEAIDICLLNYTEYLNCSYEDLDNWRPIIKEIQNLAEKSSVLAEKLRPLIERKVSTLARNHFKMESLLVFYMRICNDPDEIVRIFAPKVDLYGARTFFKYNKTFWQRRDIVVQLEEKLFYAYLEEYGMNNPEIKNFHYSFFRDRSFTSETNPSYIYVIRKNIMTPHIELLKNKVNFSEKVRVELLKRLLTPINETSIYYPRGVCKWRLHEDNIFLIGQIMLNSQNPVYKKKALLWCTENNRYLKFVSIDARKSYAEFWMNKLEFINNNQYIAPTSLGRPISITNKKIYILKALRGLCDKQFAKTIYKLVIPLLLDPDYKVRSKAFFLLETMGTSILPYLLDEIQSGDEFMAMNACFLIYGMSVKGRAALPVLEKTLSRGCQTLKPFIIRALEGIGGVSPKTVELLRRLEKSKIKSIADEAKNALILFDKRTVEAHCE